MPDFIVIEVEDGLTIAEVKPGQSPEEAAESHGGVIVDAGPFHNMEDATDALDQLAADDEEERDAP